LDLIVVAITPPGGGPVRVMRISMVLQTRGLAPVLASSKTDEISPADTRLGHTEAADPNSIELYFQESMTFLVLTGRGGRGADHV